ncbi:Cytochrome P450 704C1-like protein [Drosera capensis]
MLQLSLQASMDLSISYAPFSIVFSLAAAVLAILGIRILGQRKLERRYPPVGGTIFHQLPHFNRLHDFRADLAAKHRTFRLLSLSRSEVFTVEPEKVKYILKTNFENYGKGSENNKNLSDLLGDGIFVVDGDKWRDQRKVSSYEFSVKNLRDFSTRIFRENAVKLANVVATAASSNRVVDIQVAFGVDLDCIAGTNEEGKKFCADFDASNALTTWRYFDVLWTIKRFLNVGREAKLKRSIEGVNRFVYKIIEEARQNPSSENDSSMKIENILSRFLKLSNTNSTYLRDIILNFVIAGRDTTGSTLSWFIYALCKHPEIQEKIAQEVRDAANVHGTANYAELVAHLTDESLDMMHYLHTTLSETLRLYPAVPENPKECFSDDTLPDGYSVKKGDLVFRPDRWLSEDGIFQPENPFKFTAFQAGPRICLGKDFAYRQMKIFAAVLVSSFVFQLADEQKPVNYVMMLTLHIYGGLHVRVLHRKHGS